MARRGTGGSFLAGLSGESSDIFANLEQKIQQLRYDLGVGSIPATNILRTTLAGPYTIAPNISDVCQAFAGPMLYVLPEATVGRVVSFLKETTNAGTITVRRAGTDTIHGATADYILDSSDYVSSAITYRKAWTLVCYNQGDWQVC